MRKLAALLGLIVLAGIAATVALADGASPSFTFSTDETGATFQCSLDNGAALSCSGSKAYSGLAPGQHTVTIVSTFTVPQPVAPPPTAAFSVSPTQPVTGSPVTFDGTTSTCAATPCSYRYADKANNATLGTTQTSSFTFQNVGTKFVVLTVTDAQGRTATVENDIQVAKPGTPPPPPPPPPPGNCDLNATPSNFTAQVAAATSGQTICLGAGSYNWNGGTTKTLTITAQAGASPSFCFDLSNTQNLTIDGGHTNYDPATSGINVSCHVNIETNSKNITIERVSFTECHNAGGACFDDEAGGPSTIAFNIFHDFPACTSGSCTGLTQAVFHMYQDDTNPAETVIRSNLFTNIAADAIDVGDYGTILGNDFLNVSSPPSDPRHTDLIQWSSSGDHDVVVQGNYANGCTQGFGAYDGTSNNTITDNVIVGCAVNPLVQAADTPRSLVAHNTVIGGGLACGSKIGSPASVTDIQDNILQAGISWGGVQCTPSVDSHNMSWPSFGQIHSSTDFLGNPQFVGPTGTYAGYALAAGSPGAGKASDGSDVGARVSLYPRPAGLP